MDAFLSPENPQKVDEELEEAHPPPKPAHQQSDLTWDLVECEPVFGQDDDVHDQGVGPKIEAGHSAAVGCPLPVGGGGRLPVGSQDPANIVDVVVHDPTTEQNSEPESSSNDSSYYHFPCCGDVSC